MGAGRKAEFAEHGWGAADVPDPQDPSTFERSKLDWSELDKPEHRDLLDFYRALIALRRSHPDLIDPRLDRVEVRYDEDDRWLTVRRGACTVVANLAPAPQWIAVPDGTVLLSSDPDASLHAGQVALAGEAVAIVSDAASSPRGQGSRPPRRPS